MARRIARHAGSRDCGPTRTTTSAISFTARASGWAFQYDANVPDEVGVHFADERFVLGEYVSVNEAGKTHTYRVVVVSHL